MNDTMPGSVKECTIAGGTYSIVQELPSNKYAFNQIVTSVVYCILSFPVMLFNAITSFAILKSPQLKTKISQFPVFIQSTADFTVGLLTLPLFTYVNLNEVYGSPGCISSYILSTIAFIPWGLSLAALCALTFERYMGVIHPITHRNHLTRKKFVVYICSAVFVTLIIVPLATASAIFYYIFCAVYAIIPLLLHTFCYSRIFCSVRKRLQRDNRSTSNLAETNVALNGTRNRMKKRYSSQEIKLAKSCALVVGTFYVCCVPGEVLNIYYLEHDIIAYRVVISWYAVALGLNTLLNSLIFFWTRPILRKEAFKVLRGICAH